MSKGEEGRVVTLDEMHGLEGLDQRAINATWTMLTGDLDLKSCLNCLANHIIGGDVQRKADFLAGVTSIATVMLERSFSTEIDSLALSLPPGAV